MTITFILPPKILLRYIVRVDSVKIKASEHFSSALIPITIRPRLSLLVYVPSLLTPRLFTTENTSSTDARHARETKNIFCCSYTIVFTNKCFSSAISKTYVACTHTFSVLINNRTCQEAKACCIVQSLDIVSRVERIAKVTATTS